MNATKPGYKTTEFWLSVLAMVVSFVIGSGVLELSATSIDNQLFAFLATMLTAMGYTVARAAVKYGEMKSDALKK